MAKPQLPKKDVTQNPPASTTLKPVGTANRDVTQSPDLVMQRKVKGAGRAIGGRR